MKSIISFFTIFSLFFLNACQESASSNKIISQCSQNATLKYPLKTGQTNIFVYQDISTSPPSFYEDDGKSQKGYTREFSNLNDGTVYNANYNLYWQDNTALLENNITKAQNQCKSLVLAGKSDWRLPNVYEAMTLLHLDSRANIREASFNNMPIGRYFTSNSFQIGDKMIVIGFGKNDFNITMVDKFYDVNLSNETYGVQVGISQVPTYINGVLSYITNTTIYYDTITLLQTDVSTVKRFDVNGTLIATDGVFLNQSVPLIFPIIKEIAQFYVKCVSGPEIKGFSFTRDDKNAVVVDSASNLMWQDDKYVVQNSHRWGDSIKYCSNLELAGYKDWRLPTISEFITINDFSDNGTYSIDKAFLYKSAGKFHSSSDSCNGAECHQANYQLNSFGYFDEKISLNTQVDINPYDENNSEPYYKTRCVRCGN